jgi:hypothetical protein
VQVGAWSLDTRPSSALVPDLVRSYYLSIRLFLLRALDLSDRDTRRISAACLRRRRHFAKKAKPPTQAVEWEPMQVSGENGSPASRSNQDTLIRFRSSALRTFYNASFAFAILILLLLLTPSHRRASALLEAVWWWRVLFA